VKTFDENRIRNARRCCEKFSSASGIQYVEHTEGDGSEMFKAVCKLGLEGIVSKKVDAPYKSGPSKAWLKVKNPKAPAAARAVDGTF
jgi:ATP-dependent DNA ligase